MCSAVRIGHSECDNFNLVFIKLMQMALSTRGSLLHIAVENMQKKALKCRENVHQIISFSFKFLIAKIPLK